MNRRRPASANANTNEEPNAHAISVARRRRNRQQPLLPLPSIADVLPAEYLQQALANGNHEPNRRNLPVLPITMLPPLSAQLENNDEVEDELACVVCTEHVNEVTLPCNHVVHLSCIARSGQNTCPACRAPVQFNEQDQALYEQQRQNIEQERLQREQNESLALARQLANERDNERDNYTIVQANHRNFRVNLTDIAPGAIDANDMMLQVNQILHNFNSNVRQFAADERALELAMLVLRVNRISATTNLTPTQLLSIIENNC